MVDFPKITFDRRYPLPHIVQSGFGIFQCFIVAVNANQTSAIMQTLRNAERMSGAEHAI